MTVRENAELGVTVIEPGAKLTAENAQELLKAVQAVPYRYSRNVIVNLEQTAMVDSSGIGMLVQAMKLLRSVNGAFALAGLRPELMRSFHLMNLHQVFDIYDTEDLARQHMKRRG